MKPQPLAHLIAIGGPILAVWMAWNGYFGPHQLLTYGVAFVLMLKHVKVEEFLNQVLGGVATTVQTATAGTTPAVAKDDLDALIDQVKARVASRRAAANQAAADSNAADQKVATLAAKG